MTPEFLVAGHIVQDLLPEGGWRLGGAAAYASLLARNLGFQTAVLTACSREIDLESMLPGIAVHRVDSRETTQMRNVYHEGGRREQWVPKRAANLSGEHVPREWSEARVVLLGPVAGEVDPSLAAVFGPEALVGIGAQGWLREVGPDHRVRPVHPGAWDSAEILSYARALFLSDEDLPPADSNSRPKALAQWCRLVEVVAFTRGYEGADVCYRGEWRRIVAFPSTPSELTGAGDVFAAAFLLRFAESKDPWEAMRFASAAASIVIEGVGVGGVPATREAIEERLREHPEISPVL